jgi:hypothetical protein
LASATFCVLAAGAPANAVRLTRVSDDSPAAFDFTYQFQPQPGNRHWARTPDRETWTETYPDGLVTTFPIEFRMDVDGDHGTVVGSPTFEVFIPDIGSRMMWARFRHERSDWQWLGEMRNVYGQG